MASELAAAVTRGERGAVAQALNLIDARKPETRARTAPLLRELIESGPDNAIRIGLTGAPGAGKSTLLDALIGELRRREQTIGIIAVDPSSQQTGGALLADRVRARRGDGDTGVFFRSMAARSRLGGLAAATRAGIKVLSAAYDWVVVETVGVGQSEVEIADMVDTLVYVAQPGAGDILQYMKAGLLELPDIFAVNKADLGAPAERTRQELRRGLELGAPADRQWKAPVLLLSASEDRGIGELVGAVAAHRAAFTDAEQLDRRRTGNERFVMAELAIRYGAYGIAAIGGTEALQKILVSAPESSEFEILERTGTLIERALSAH
jgi:LAO/AO transport system kinase